MYEYHPGTGTGVPNQTVNVLRMIRIIQVLYVPVFTYHTVPYGRYTVYSVSYRTVHSIVCERYSYVRHQNQKGSAREARAPTRPLSQLHHERADKAIARRDTSRRRHPPKTSAASPRSGLWHKDPLRSAFRTPSLRPEHFKSLCAKVKQRKSLCTRYGYCIDRKKRKRRHFASTPTKERTPLSQIACDLQCTL